MFLRSEDGEPDIGESVTLSQMWALSQPWYGDRLDESFTPRSVDAAQSLLDSVGLTSSFWQLRA